MDVTLALLLSIPHGGDVTPPEVRDRVVASARDLFEDGDALTRPIYDVGKRVAHVEQASVARAFVDLNRAADDRPPRNPDGVVKGETCYGRPIYRTSQELDAATTEALLERYYHPYHEALARVAASGVARFGLDCHSMASQAPKIAPDQGDTRPLFCLSNGDGTTCDEADLRRLGESIAAAFDCDATQVSYNVPFKGGFITRRHGRDPLPWAQIEMNRSLYLAEPWFDSERLSVAQDRLRELNERFLGALRRFTT